MCQYNNIPIITYHKVSNDKDFGLTTITRNNFETHIKTILLKGFIPITFKALKKKNKLPEKPIIITFDDGYESVYTNGFPILQKYDIPAVVFIVANYIDKINNWEAIKIQRQYKHLSKSQILELSDFNIEIGSHGLNHRYLPICSQNIIDNEVIHSKKLIENIIGDCVISFCFPYGRYNKKVLNSVKKAGYDFSASNIELLRLNKKNSINLYRRSIYSNDSITKVINKVENPLTFRVSYLSEWIIQKGALASITLNLFKKSTVEV